MSTHINGAGRRAIRLTGLFSLLAAVAVGASCQGSGGSSASSGNGLAQLEGPDRAEGRELNDIDMSHEMDDMSDARYDAAEAEIEGGG